MARPPLLFAITIAFSSCCSADHSSTENTILRVYPVGDLVSVDAMNSGAGGRTTSREWASEYPETLKALEDLRSIVEAMCPPETATVVSYAPSLCLIVRHSEDGHKEIGQLLQTLSDVNRSSILMECRVLCSDTQTKPDHQRASETAQDRLQALLSKRTLTEPETKELLALFPPDSSQKEAVTLKPGRRTPWGSAGRPCTALGRVNHAENTVELRIDFISDDYAPATPFGSETFSLAEGEAALFRHYCDGGTVVRLVSARIGSPKPTTPTSTTPTSKSDR